MRMMSQVERNSKKKKKNKNWIVVFIFMDEQSWFILWMVSVIFIFPIFLYLIWSSFHNFSFCVFFSLAIVSLQELSFCFLFVLFIVWFTYIWFIRPLRIIIAECYVIGSCNWNKEIIYQFIIIKCIFAYVTYN